MEQPSAIISLKRGKTASNQFRRFVVNIDDRNVGKIGSGERKQYRLPCGTHAIRVKLDLFKSRQLLVDLKPGQTLELICGDRSPENLKEVFTLKGVEKSLSALVNPGGYLYVEPATTPQESLSPDRKIEQPVKKREPSGRREGGRPAKLFVSYRREDSQEITGRICDRLSGEFGKEMVFRDLDSIPAAVDFRDHIGSTIGHCCALAAIIGDEWLEVKNSRGELRLKLQDDPLRVEIETALEKGIPIVPVLVKGASMPTEESLPQPLKPLAYRNAVIIPREPYFHEGVDRLIGELEQLGLSSRAKKADKRHYCIHCGNQLAPENSFCTQCGRPV